MARFNTVLLQPDNMTVSTISLGSNPSSSGEIRLPNLGTIQSRNGANSGNVTMAFVDASNVVQLGGGAGMYLNPGSGDIKWGKALVALGGTVAVTLSTGGGSGPTTAAQNSWLRAIDSTGAACWIPIWK